MTAPAETVTLIRSAVGELWHILAPNRDETLCGSRLPEDASVEVGIDRHVVAHRGKRICTRCRWGI